jgi:dTMP kinase
MPPKRGLFLSLDGPDGSGKSTQCRLLADWLRGLGHTIVTCTDPGGTPLGTALRKLLKEEQHPMSPWSQALLFMASRAELVSEVIRPALEAGSVVVCDRYLLSTVVYQGHAGGLDPDLVWQLGRITAEVEPDLTLVLNVPVETSVLRCQRRREGHSGIDEPSTDRFEDREVAYHRKVHDGFLFEAKRAPERIQVLDAAAEVAVVQDAIRHVVIPLLKR